MTEDHNHSRRDFLLKLPAFVLGCTSAAFGLFVAFRGSKIDPFLSMKADAVLARFGSGRELLKNLDISDKKQRECGMKVAAIKEKFDEKYGSSGGNGPALVSSIQKSIKLDFRKNRYVEVEGWILSETEVGLFIFNKMKKHGLI